MDLVVSFFPARSLRSAEQNVLAVKRYNIEHYGRRSFSVAGPSLWNALPSALGTLCLYLLSDPVSKLTFFARRLSICCRSIVVIVLLFLTKFACQSVM